MEPVQFITAMSNDPIFCKDDPDKLSPRVQKVIDKLVKHGADPLTEMKKALEFVETQVSARAKYKIDEEKILRKGNRFKVGTFTWWIYIRKMTRLIVQHLAAERVDKAFGL